MTTTKALTIASALNYHPEWYWDSTVAMDKAAWQQVHGSPAQTSFGSSYLWRQPSFEQTHHYRAYLSEEPGTIPNERFSFWLYHTFSLAYTGIQLAGPNLTTQTLADGLNTYRYTNGSDPFTPTGGFGANGPDAVAPWTFIDTSMAWWWDPPGRDAGSTTGVGCIRLANEGARSYPGRWPTGDSDLFTPDAPCGGEVQRAYP